MFDISFTTSNGYDEPYQSYFNTMGDSFKPYKHLGFEDNHTGGLNMVFYEADKIDITTGEIAANPKIATYL